MSQLRAATFWTCCNFFKVCLGSPNKSELQKSNLEDTNACTSVSAVWKLKYFLMRLIHFWTKTWISLERVKTFQQSISYFLLHRFFKEISEIFLLEWRGFPSTSLEVRRRENPRTEREKTSRSKYKNQQQTQPTYDGAQTASPGIEAGPHWWKGSTLTTAPSLLP